MFCEVNTLAKKLLLSILLVALILPGFTPVYANNLLINGGFDDAIIPFDNVSLYNAVEYGGNNCGLLTAGELQDGFYRYRAAYSYPIRLEQGSLYSLSLRVYCPNKTNTSPVSSIYYDTQNNDIIFSISGASNFWHTVSGVFIAGSDKDFDLTLEFISSIANDTILIDDISLTRSNIVPVSMRLEGPSSIFVPERGYSSYNYRATAVDARGNTIPLIQGDITLSELPHGVTYNEDFKTISVSSDAALGESFVITATPPSALPTLSLVSLTVTTGKNYIVNGDFNDYPELYGFFSSTSNLILKNDTNYGKTAYLEPVELGEGNYMATINVDETYFLDASKIYVFRAMVRSESIYYSRQTQAHPGIVNSDGSISINVTNVGPEWTEITSVIEVFEEGIYQLNINFFSTDRRPVYFDHAGLYAEALRPTRIDFSAPAHVNIPSSDTMLIPISYAVKDQRNQIVPGEDVEVTVVPSGKGVLIDGKMLLISPSAVSGVYEIKATDVNYPEACGTHKIVVSNEMIGDGSFEVHASGQWFSTAPPSSFNITTIYKEFVPSDGEKFGKLTFCGNVSALLADSVIKLYSGKAYVFNSYIKSVVPDIATTATVFIYNVFGESFEDNLAVLQFDLGDTDSYSKVFIPERDITGRLMIAFTTPPEHDSQIVLIDNISIVEAGVSATNVAISGYPYPDRILTGKYRFWSNFDTTDMSTYRWLISPTKDGVYMPISGETENILSVSGEMLGKFIKFEVTPSSLDGPVSGVPRTSPPIEIINLPKEGGGPPVSTPSEEDEEYEEDNDTQIPNSSIINKGTAFSVINIYADSFSVYKNTFFDTIGHWAQDDIRIMNAAGIVNGRGKNLFEPNEPITRAEFSAFLIRAFSLAPLYYQGGFDDVKGYEWYAGTVETVTKYNMAQGVGERLFAPDVPITREQVTLMTMNALEMTGVKVNGIKKSPFTDYSKISPWAQDAVNKAVSAGIVSGYFDFTFRPDEKTTRAEAVAILKRMLTYVITAEP